MEHLEWLVQSRSANQQATVALFLLIKTHKRLISKRVALQDVAEELAAVAFSLWRAVFLSDLVKGDDERLTHLDLFLESLIADNTVVYATDKRSREWTFQYYMRMPGFACSISPRDLPTTSWTRLSSSGVRITRKTNGPDRHGKSPRGRDNAFRSHPRRAVDDERRSGLEQSLTPPRPAGFTRGSPRQR